MEQEEFANFSYNLHHISSYANEYAEKYDPIFNNNTFYAKKNRAAYAARFEMDSNVNQA